MPRISWILLAVIVLAAFFLRMHRLEEIALWLDETDFFNESTYAPTPMPIIDYVVDRKDHTTSAIGWPAIMWVSARVFGRTAAAARTGTVLMGTAAVLLVFLILRWTTGSALPGLFAAALAAISIPLMEFSQRTYPYGAMPFFSALIILTHLWVVWEDPSGKRPLARLSVAMFCSSLVGGLALYVNGTLAVAGGVSFLVILGVLARELPRRSRDDRWILAALTALAGLVLFVAAIGGAKNPKHGLRSYLQDYYHHFDPGAIPFLLSRTYDLLTYHLNLFFNPALYWPLAANLAMLPLVLLCLLGCGLALTGRFGVMTRRLAILGVASVAAPALLSLRDSFPFGGVRQTLFLAPYLIMFTALGFYSLRISRWSAAAGCALAAVYLGFWAKNLPAFYADRVIPFHPREIAETWEQHGKLDFYDQGACAWAIQYWTRERPEIKVREFDKIPDRSFFLISLNWPLENANWDPKLAGKLRAAGFTQTLLKAYPSKHMESWKYPTSLYFPPSGLWIYKFTK